MKKLLPILVFLFASFSSYAQNWNPLNPGAKNYFTNVHGYLRGMRIDSVNAYGNELHYYPFKTMRGPDIYSDQDTAGSWLGEEVIKKADGTFLFLNYWGDTTRLNTLAPTGASWVFYRDSDMFYQADVVSVDTMTILGVVDSVKSIMLTAYNNNNMPVMDSLNNTELVLSKAHGFYQVFEIYFFPFHAPGATTLFNDRCLTYSFWPDWLTNIPSANKLLFKLTDFVDPTKSELYNWDVGDYYEYSDCNGIPLSLDCHFPDWYYVDTIIAKTVLNDGVEYVKKGWFASFDTVVGNHGYYNFTQGIDTFFVPDSGSIFPVEYMPEEIAPGNMPIYYYYYPNDTGCVPGNVYYSRLDQTGISTFLISNTYKTGIDLTEYYYYDGTDNVEYNKRLRFFVKNGATCGSFYMPDTSSYIAPNGVTSNIKDKDLKIYPNPATEQLNIEAPTSGYKLSLINAMGQVVYNKDGCDNKQTIDVGVFVNGVYYIRVETAEHEVINRKVIIQN